MIAGFAPNHTPLSNREQRNLGSTDPSFNDSDVFGGRQYCGERSIINIPHDSPVVFPFPGATEEEVVS